MANRLKLVLVSLSFMASAAQSAVFTRWTGSEDTNAALPHVISELSTRMGVTLDPATFVAVDVRDLAYTHFGQFVQTADGTPIAGTSIRIWSSLATGKLIQMESNVETPAAIRQTMASTRLELMNRTGRSSIRSSSDLLPDSVLRAIVLRSLRGHEDGRASMKGSAQVMWVNGRLVSVSTLTGKRGTHEVNVDLLTRRVSSSVYSPFPEEDRNPRADQAGDLQLEADLFPVYEEDEDGVILPRERMTLRYILPTARVSQQDPFLPLSDMRYFDSKADEVQGRTPEGRAAGFWSMSMLAEREAQLAQAVPVVSNTFSNGGSVRLVGRYCSVMIHPDALAAFPNTNFTPKFSDHAFEDWKEVEQDGEEDYELKINGSFYGKPIDSAAEAAARPATRHPSHDAQTYLNEGFDDLQVYSGVNKFFEAFQTQGFSDPELSTRPFMAYLYNPDIKYRDNAFYTNDTINFTTYSPKGDNAARNNGTIWHELGHGLMDRLMGTVKLADTGGLSEGMADFVGNLVLETAVGRQEFPGRHKMRIYNNTGFVLTNEVHDDGESYGGAMHDILEAAIAQYGAAGTHKVVDLTLETMRLTRGHPHLTAADFFDHMIFADLLGRPGLRAAGEMTALINEAIAKRNFVRGTQKPASFSLKYNNVEVAAGKAGSRDNEIKLILGAQETKTMKLSFSVADGDDFQFHYPLRAKLFKTGRGALQGAVHWVGEELGPVDFSITGPGEVIRTTVDVLGACDAVNRPDGVCSDYVYLLIFDDTISTEMPIAKKRFYVKVVPRT
jgi:hypothetical protein